MNEHKGGNVMILLSYGGNKFPPFPNSLSKTSCTNIRLNNNFRYLVKSIHKC